MKRLDPKDLYKRYEIEVDPNDVQSFKYFDEEDVDNEEMYISLLNSLQHIPKVGDLSKLIYSLTSEWSFFGSRLKKLSNFQQLQVSLLKHDSESLKDIFEQENIKVDKTFSDLVHLNQEYLSGHVLSVHNQTVVSNISEFYSNLCNGNIYILFSLILAYIRLIHYSFIVNNEIFDGDNKLIVLFANIIDKGDDVLYIIPELYNRLIELKYFEKYTSINLNENI